MKARNIPHRFRESQFRRYAAQLSRAVEVFPESITFEPVSVTPAVFAQGIRDAMAAKDTYGWKWLALDEAKYAEVRDFLKASVKENIVIVGPRQPWTHAKETRFAELKRSIIVRVQLPDNFETASLILHNLLTLIDTGAIADSVRYEVHNMTKVWECYPNLNNLYPNVHIQRHETDPSIAILI